MYNDGIAMMIPTNLSGRDCIKRGKLVACLTKNAAKILRKLQRKFLKRLAKYGGVWYYN